MVGMVVKGEGEKKQGKERNADSFLKHKCYSYDQISKLMDKEMFE